VVHFLATQGFGLDPLTGIRPFVTSSHTGTAGLLTGLGLPDPLELIPEHMAVIPAYLTVKGERPFVTEIKDPALVQRLRKSAGQFDRKMTTDGQLFDDVTDTKHRVGYMDAVMLAHYLGLNHVTQAALTKLDVWDGFETVKVGVGYAYDGPEREAIRAAFGDRCEDRGSHLMISAFNPTLSFLRGSRPVYKEFPWRVSVRGIKNEADLPKEARDLIAFLEQATDIPFHVIKTGPEPEATILRNI
jgi:adenylosuccinate synthase